MKFNNITLKNIFSISIILFFIFSIVMMYGQCSEIKKLKAEHTGFEDNKKSYDLYTSKSYEQIHKYFFDSYCKISNGGENSSDKTLFDILNRMGAKIKYVDKKDFVEKLNTYKRIRMTATIPFLNKISRGDFIILRKEIGIISDINGNYLRYITTDKRGINFKIINVYSKRIKSIVYFSFAIWAGTDMEYDAKVTRGKTWYHDGIDLVLGTKYKRVYSFTAGKVVKCFTRYNPRRAHEGINRAGNFISVEYQNGGKTYYIRYLHLVNIKVKKGDIIQKGQLLGQYSNTGYSFGEHLHVDLHDSTGKSYDPLYVVKPCFNNLFYGRDKNEYFAQIYDNPFFGRG